MGERRSILKAKKDYRRTRERGRDYAPDGEQKGTDVTIP